MIKKKGQFELNIPLSSNFSVIGLRSANTNKVVLCTVPSNTYAFVAKYRPMGSVTMRTVKNSSVFRADTREPSFLQEDKIW